MSLTRVLARPRVGQSLPPVWMARRRGMGALSPGNVSYNDTGDGITPESFASTCCVVFGDVLGVPVSTSGSGAACDAFYNANAGKFGGMSRCSPGALQSLLLPSLSAPTVISPAAGPTIDPTMGQPISPCTGLPVLTADDLTAYQTCIGQSNQTQQTAANTAQAAANLANQCALLKATCAADTFSMFKSPDAECLNCSIDFTKPATIAAVGLGVLALVLAFKSFA